MYLLFTGMKILCSNSSNYSTTTNTTPTYPRCYSFENCNYCFCLLKACLFLLCCRCFSYRQRRARDLPSQTQLLVKGRRRCATVPQHQWMCSTVPLHQWRCATVPLHQWRCATVPVPISNVNVSS